MFVEVGKMSVFVVLVDQHAETVMFPSWSVTVNGYVGESFRGNTEFEFER